MFKKIIRIKFCFENDPLEEILRSVAIPANCEAKYLKKDDAQECDLCLVTGSEIHALKAIQKDAGAHSRIIWLFHHGDEIDRASCDLIYDRILVEDDPFWLKRRFELHLHQFSLRHAEELNRKYLDAVIDNSESLIWLKTKNGIHIDVNESFCKAMGKERAQIIGRDPSYIWNFEDGESKQNGGSQQAEDACAESDGIVVNSKKRGSFFETVETVNGIRRFSTVKSPFFDDAGEVVGTVGIATDITDVLNLGSEIQLIIDQMPFGIILHAEDGRIFKSNSFVKKVLNAEGIKEDAQKNIYTIKQQLVSKGWENALLSKSHKDIIRYNNGRRQWFMVNRSELKDVFGHKIGYLATYEDVTPERKHTERLKKKAMTDALTCIGNRRFFYEQIEKIRDAEGTEGLIFMDLNKFKELNDALGHEAGDKALKTTAAVLQKLFSDPDRVFARYGGDEFVIYLKLSERAELEEAVAVLSDSLHEAFGDSGIAGLGASLGAVFNAGDKHDTDMLINVADSCMYEAKRKGLASFILSLS